MYVYILGRVQSIGLLTVSDVEALLDPTRYVESNKFKTAATYGTQPIRLTDLGRKALTLYMNIFRLNMKSSHLIDFEYCLSCMIFECQLI